MSRLGSPFHSCVSLGVVSTFTRVAILLVIIGAYIGLVLVCRRPDDFPLPATLLYLPLLFGPPVFAAFGNSGLFLLLLSTIAFFALAIFALFASRRRVVFAAAAAIVWLGSGFFMYALHI